MLIINIMDYLLIDFLVEKYQSWTRLVLDSVSCLDHHVSVQFIYNHLLERGEQDTIKPSTEREQIRPREIRGLRRSCKKSRTKVLLEHATRSQSI